MTNYSTILDARLPIAVLRPPFAGFFRRMIERRAYRQLRFLDDHLLRDIGLGRAEVEGLAKRRPAPCITRERRHAGLF